MTVIDLSSDAGLIGMVLLTINLLLGLLISLRFNPRKQWPHRPINIFKIHNWTAYFAISREGHLFTFDSIAAGSPRHGRISFAAGVRSGVHDGH